MTKHTSISIDELRIRAQELGLRISLNDGDGKWYAINYGTAIAAKEQSKRMALACAIARTEAGVFDEN
jgi:hypothetical protein